MHRYEDLIEIFNKCFFESHNTQLIKGSGEPLYLPASEDQPYNAIFFANGFFASALHECSHWLIAGESRRAQVDFGYWYEPDGRSEPQQKLFEQVEVKPQALEWILSASSGYRFYTSSDNLNGTDVDTYPFKKAVHSQVKAYIEKGLPARAETLRLALCSFYGKDPLLKIEDFSLETL